MQQPTMPLRFYDRLEREWRLIEPDREQKEPMTADNVEPATRRTRIGRVD